MPADRNIDHLYPDFAVKVRTILNEGNAFLKKNHPDYTYSVVEGLRSAKYQNELYQQGRTKPGAIVTQRDGYKHPSNHQSGLAVDVVPFHKGQPDWNAPKALWDYIGHLARTHGCDWGGDWKSFVDTPHVEWDPEDDATYNKARAWLKKEGLA
jgi:peptidoglycan L-alanyl-D-glutamate endopeptidase CwlK